MNRNAAQLNELIAITRDGQHFYQHALEEVQDAQLQELFREMAETKDEVIQALTLSVASGQEQPARGGTLLGRLRELYADTRASLARDLAATYVDQLEAAEDRILQAFEDAMASAEPDVRALLAMELPKLRACHERMRDLKMTLH
ncbi:MAG: PA2169 family four-helix-bundle protein [Pseudomonas sp.]